jgi:hypothetical protein
MEREKKEDGREEAVRVGNPFMGIMEASGNSFE